MRAGQEKGRKGKTRESGGREGKEGGKEGGREVKNRW